MYKHKDTFETFGTQTPAEAAAQAVVPAELQEAKALEVAVAADQTAVAAFLVAFAAKERAKSEARFGDEIDAERAAALAYTANILSEVAYQLALDAWEAVDEAAHKVDLAIGHEIAGDIGNQMAIDIGNQTAKGPWFSTGKRKE